MFGMRRVVQNSKTLGRDRTDHLSRHQQKRFAKTDAAEDLPPFIAGKSARDNINASDVNFAKTVVPAQRLQLPRGRRIFGKIFQSIAYLCLFIGIMAVLVAIVAAVLRYWPLSSSSVNNTTNNITTSGGSWWWLSLTMLSPIFVFIMELIIGVVVILFVVWGWAAAVRATRRLVWRLADEFMKPLSLIEPMVLLTLWVLAIVGVWWLADTALFWPLTICALSFLIVGLICFGIFRKLVGDRLDFSRVDVMKK